MNYIFLFYLILLAYFIYLSSRKKTLYVFSILLCTYLSFGWNEIIPLFLTKHQVPQTLLNITFLTTIINIVFLLIYKNQWITPVKLSINSNLYYKKYSSTRNIVLVIFLLLIFFAGFYTGLTQALLAGADVENLRVTSNLGMGFIRALPVFGLPFIILEKFILDKYLTFKKAALIGLLLGFLMFMTTASRDGILTYAMCFFIWFSIRRRAFKWYEYMAIFYIAKPVIANILKFIRSAGASGDTEIKWSLFDYPLMILEQNTIRLVNFVQDSNIYFYGESYFYDIVRYIPRFLWPNKPMPIDFVYKDLTGMEFDGGGIFTTPSVDFYLNFGYWFVVPYILWLWLVHTLYGLLFKSNIGMDVKLFVMLTASGGFQIGHIIQRGQSFFLFLLIFYLFNKRWRIV